MRLAPVAGWRASLGVVLLLACSALAEPPRSEGVEFAMSLADASVRGMDRVELRGDGRFVARGRISGRGRVWLEDLLMEGTLAPGDSPGCITFSGNITFSLTATYEVEIGGSQPCTQHDQISVGGTLTINGATLRLSLIDGFVPGYGDSFDVMDWGALSGSFGAIDHTLAPLSHPLTWDVSQLHATGEIRVGVLAIADGDLYPVGSPDGEVTLSDLLVLQQIVLGQLSAGPLQLAHGDIHPVGNPDGRLDMGDVLLLQRQLLEP